MTIIFYGHSSDFYSVSILNFLFILFLNTSTDFVINGAHPTITTNDIIQYFNFIVPRLNINRPIGVKNARMIMPNIDAHNIDLNKEIGRASCRERV